MFLIEYSDKYGELADFECEAIARTNGGSICQHGMKE